MHKKRHDPSKHTEPRPYDPNRDRDPPFEDVLLPRLLARFEEMLDETAARSVRAEEMSVRRTAAWERIATALERLADRNAGNAG
jgi:hypothetical protein